MDNWVKIQSFERLHQAELRKNILAQNNINSVIVNEKDSLFLIGNIELFVEEKDEKKAKALINDFAVHTKINSFIDMKPVLLLQKILKEKGIETSIKRQESEKYILGNYELYVDNEDLEKTIPYLTGEKLNGWKKLKECKKVRQTKHYVDLLSENLINSIIIKKKDSDYHLELVNIYVKNEDFEKAKKTISELNGYTQIKESDNYSTVEKIEETLSKNSVKAIIKKADNLFQLFVEDDNVELANEIINSNIKWVELKTFSNIANALYYKGVLDAENIPSVIINEKDNSFLLGEIDLLTEEDYYTKANEIIKNL